MQRGHPSASLTLGTSPVGEAFGSVFCLPFRGGGKNRQLKLSIFAGGVSTAQVEKIFVGSLLSVTKSVVLRIMECNQSKGGKMLCVTMVFLVTTAVLG